MRRGHLRAPCSGESGGSNWPRAERSSWTKSANYQPDTQIALLRVLQEHEFERVGGTQSIRADVRVIAATNRDLKAAVCRRRVPRGSVLPAATYFRLRCRLLRARKEDIPLLVEYFIDRYARKAGKNIRSVEKRTLQVAPVVPLAREHTRITERHRTIRNRVRDRDFYGR